MRQLHHRMKEKSEIWEWNAGMIVQEAMKYSSAISLEIGTYMADGKHFFDVMSLAAVKGCELTVEVQGPDEDRAIVRLAELIGQW